MRPQNVSVATDHNLLIGVGSEDHHVTAVTGKIQINGLSIPPGVYNYTIALGKSGCKTIQGIIRGDKSVDIQGHTGVWFVGTSATQNSSSYGLRPYPSGTQSYVGGYSRLHGDTYISHCDFGQNAILLLDVYISGTNAVFSFSNGYSANRLLRCYGSFICK